MPTFLLLSSHCKLKMNFNFISLWFDRCAIYCISGGVHVGHKQIILLCECFTVIYSKLQSTFMKETDFDGTSTFWALTTWLFTAGTFWMPLACSGTLFESFWYLSYGTVWPRVSKSKMSRSQSVTGCLEGKCEGLYAKVSLYALCAFFASKRFQKGTSSRRCLIVLRTPGA